MEYYFGKIVWISGPLELHLNEVAQVLGSYLCKVLVYHSFGLGSLYPGHERPGSRVQINGHYKDAEVGSHGLEVTPLLGLSRVSGSYPWLIN